MLAVVLWPSAAPATVEEQRARLPPAADCADPVEGMWLAIMYTEQREEWYEYSIDVKRVAPGSNQLKGEMTSHFWHGGAGDQKPPACNPIAGYEAVVKMPNATGSISPKGELLFGATTWRLDKMVCGVSRILYNPDHFSGTIDPVRQEFQSVNNDGGNAVNEPAVFRRVSCFDSPRKVGVDVKPPDYAPPKKGCGAHW
jgi:hypothetical protein